MTPQTWTSPDLPVTQRVSALLTAMTLEEKVGQLHQVGNADPVRDAVALAAGSFGSCIMGSGEQAGNVRDAGVRVHDVNALQRAAVETSRLGIPLLIARDVIHGHRTVFPIPLGQAASFDAELVRLCARATAREASADGVRWTFAPMIDIAHDPRWGRVAESWGEDPWLSARLGAAAIEGFQGGPGGAGLAEPDSLAACAKHYVGYGLVAGRPGLRRGRRRSGHPAQPPPAPLRGSRRGRRRHGHDCLPHPRPHTDDRAHGTRTRAPEVRARLCRGRGQ